MRFFVGLEIPSPVRLAMEERTERLRRSLPHASWVTSANYHLLLAFLGDREEGSLGALGKALSVAFASHVVFDVQLAGAGSFPPLRPARVLWIGVEDRLNLESLHRCVWESLTPVVDIETDWRPFHAHATVARCRRPWSRRCVEIWCRSCAGKVGGSFSVRQGALFASLPCTEGFRYQVIETYPMKELH